MHYYDENVKFVVMQAGLYWRAVGVSKTLRGAKCLARRICNKNPYRKNNLYVFAREDLIVCRDADCFFVPNPSKLVKIYYRLSDFDGKWKMR